MDKTKPGILAALREVLPPTRIGQLVKHHYPARLTGVFLAG
jgi:hypothetical protein